MSSFNEIFNKTVFQDGGPDILAILNISVIQNSNLHSVIQNTFNPIWKTLQETN